ncbi:MAG: excinuclease ABC subunit C [Bacilli bacterium]|nr:excinuclease ABC subunit C [Bacilli bacterium]
MNERIKNDINLLPDKPGVYQMFDKDGTIIYVGKAKNLKNRVSQYFLNAQVGKTFAMVSHVDHFQIIITNNEKEAFLLEMNLIQKYMPRYNILLKDDKHYPYIAIHNVKHPYISIARKINDKRCEYFGPYPRSSSAFDVIDLLNKLYPLRKCNTVPKTACLYYHLGQCLGPCIREVTKEEYDEILDSIRRFLKGDNKEVLSKLKAQIKELSNNLEFERANELKKYYEAILHINDQQHIELQDKVDRDIFAFYTQENYCSLSLFIYRKGELIGKRNFTYEIIGDLNEFIVNLISQYYEYNLLPKEIVVGTEEIKERLESLLDAKIVTTTRGKLFDLIGVVQENAKDDLKEHFVSARLDDDKLEVLERLGEILHIPTPYNIELFDNSHLQGTNAIGAMVNFINGEPNKRGYRTYNIMSENKKDDLSSMEEVLTRRYSRLRDEGQKFPDLVILDGGENQLNIGKKVFNQLNISINLVGLVKSDKHKTNGLLDVNGNEFYFEDDKPLFYMLTRMQDEVHRFAIKTHIKKRSKSVFVSIFDGIEGLGPKKRELLLKRFNTIEELSNASLEEFEQILPKNIALQLYNKLRGIE